MAWWVKIDKGQSRKKPGELWGYGISRGIDEEIATKWYFHGLIENDIEFAGMIKKKLWNFQGLVLVWFFSGIA